MRVLVTASARAFSNPESDMAAVLPNKLFAGAREELESYADKPWFLRIMSVMTVVLGLILVVETAVRSVLIFSLPTEKVLLLGPVVKYSAVGLLMLLTLVYFVPAVRRGERSDEAEASALSS